MSDPKTGIKLLTKAAEKLRISDYNKEYYLTNNLRTKDPKKYKLLLESRKTLRREQLKQMNPEQLQQHKAKMRKYYSAVKAKRAAQLSQKRAENAVETTKSLGGSRTKRRSRRTRK
jgi:hypothetical protein